MSYLGAVVAGRLVSPRDPMDFDTRFSADLHPVSYRPACQQIMLYPGNFQEGFPMKLRSLVVITLFALGCSFASAQTYTFGFADSDGNLFCDYEQIGLS